MNHAMKGCKFLFVNLPPSLIKLIYVNFIIILFYHFDSW